MDILPDPISFHNRTFTITSTADHFTLRKPPKAHRKLSHDSNLKILSQFSNIEWMKKHGKGEYIDISNKERAKIRSIFKELDKDGSGALGIDELYSPLLALGLVENKDQVKEMMAKVDSNGSGLIEFDEFISIIKHNTTEKNALISFFKNLSNETSLNEFKDLPFNLVLSNKRRELMMQNYLGKDACAREHGRKIMNAFEIEMKEQEEKMYKAEKLRIRKETMMRRFIERQNAIRNARDGKVNDKSTFIGDLSRPRTASRKPMTRKEILML
ncbi:hypothetical protein SteCoe_23894 [Stentor coeruleus]|uniref:EF-hand domain-containing protein n=1 Tax=Stentor coeruleus TaxID=5963 RepID=A0A1R2BJB3_9CILI|nr:hypothetical protein SteCoe_23894 [Stentor coeruleus]